MKRQYRVKRPMSQPRFLVIPILVLLAAMIAIGWWVSA